MRRRWRRWFRWDVVDLAVGIGVALLAGLIWLWALQSAVR